MPSSADELSAAIAAAGGPIPFEQFMAIALYGTTGFYSVAGRAGRRGDFLTSAEVGPLFGTVLSGALRQWWDELGQPADFTVVEVGAGPGTLARAILAADESGFIDRYVAVETSAQQRAFHPAGVESVGELPPGPITGVVLANELLDNLPFRLAVYDGSWSEAYVDLDRGGRPVEVLSAPFDPPPAVLPAGARHGTRLPLQDQARAWVERAGSVLRPGGRVVAIDYCTARTAILADEPWRAWLRTYRGHQRGGHYLADVGQQDITAQVCLDQLPEPDVVRTQAQFLQRWGIAELVDEGRQAWRAAAAAPTVAALKMRSRIAEAEALLDPDGLGGFTVAEWVVARR